MKKEVKPIKDSWVLKSVQKNLLDQVGTGRRDYTIFQVGKATLLRMSDVLSFKKVTSLMNVEELNATHILLIKRPRNAIFYI